MDVGTDVASVDGSLCVFSVLDGGGDVVVGGGAEVVSPVAPGGLLVPCVPVAEEVGVEEGDAAGAVGLVAGSGRGLLGSTLCGLPGSKNSATPRPAMANAKPPACCRARVRRRVRTPARRRSRCRGSKGACSWVLCISCASCRSK